MAETENQSSSSKADDDFFQNNLFQIDQKASITDILSKFDHHLQERKYHHLGYPCDMDFDFKDLSSFTAKYNLNNCGDPFIDSKNFGMHLNWNF